MNSPQQENTQAIYSSKDLASTLNIQESTLRKYCLLLEEEGYKFHKNEHSHRGFFDSDIIVIRKIIELKNKGDITLKQATKSVMAWKNGNVITDLVTDKERYDIRYNTMTEEFKAFREQQQVFNQELLEQLKKQQEYINSSLKERDKNLMIAMKESMETQKLLAVANQKKWWKFWK
jgi:DNA-binding transcriptional MerR regulator